jgi:hypothetical protein
MASPVFVISARRGISVAIQPHSRPSLHLAPSVVSEAVLFGFKDSVLSKCALDWG